MQDQASGSQPATHLTKRELNWYALGSLPGGVGAMAMTYLIFYYNQVLGISGAAIGTAALITSIFDAITDPVAGAISDRTRGRFGRRHPYLLAAAIPSAIGFYLFWAPPTGFALPALMAWLLVVHLVKRLIDTFYAVPYLALGAEISSDYEERTRITTARNIYFHVGRAVAGALLLLYFLRPTPEFPNGQLNPAGYVGFGAFFSVAILIALLCCAWYTRGWIPRLSTAAVAEVGSGWAMPFREFRTALRYRSFRAVLFGSVSRHIAWGLSEALGLYMATYFWQVDTTKLFLWGVGMFTGLFWGLPFWKAMAQRFDKKPICIVGDGTYLLFFCVPYLLKIQGFWPELDSPYYIPLYIFTTGFLAHFGIAASSVLTGSMLGDITDLDELETGRRREGVIFGAESFTWKALTGLGPLAAGLVLDFVGLSKGVSPDDVPSEVVIGLGIAQGSVMTFFFALAVLFISQYDVTRDRHRQIMSELESRRPSPA